MSFGAILVGLGLLLLTTLVLVRPWRRQSGQGQIPAVAAALVLQTAQPTLETQRDAAYAAIADLDFDHDLGKLNGDDYRTVRARLVEQAVAVLRGLDEATTDIESQIEALVRNRRAARESSGRVLNEPSSLAARMAGQNAASALNCVTCGAMLGTDDRFCCRCGTPVDACCPRCGAAVHGEDLFCASCGSTVVVRAAAA